jgi:hypothetical protein
VGMVLTILGVTMVNVTPSSFSKEEEIISVQTEVEISVDDESSNILKTNNHYGSFEVNYTKL